jgi:hypothetical protein
LSRLLEELVRKQVCFRAIGGSDACRVSEEAVLELSLSLSLREADSMLQGFVFVLFGIRYREIEYLLLSFWFYGEIHS